jgi:hypothetical protein
VLFVLIAFLGVLDGSLIVPIIVSTMYSRWAGGVVTPDLRIVYGLKRAVHEDYYDYRTDFTPLS